MTEEVYPHSLICLHVHDIEVFQTLGLEIFLFFCIMTGGSPGCADEIFELFNQLCFELPEVVCGDDICWHDVHDFVAAKVWVSEIFRTQVEHQWCSFFFTFYG